MEHNIIIKCIRNIWQIVVLCIYSHLFLIFQFLFETILGHWIFNNNHLTGVFLVYLLRLELKD